jgi:hypothetical protein
LAACRRIRGTFRNPRGSRCHTLGSKQHPVHRPSRPRRCRAASHNPDTCLSFLRSPAPFRSPRRLAGSGLRAPAKAALHVHPDLRKLQLGRFHWFLSFPFQTRAGLLTRARLVLDYQAQHCDSRPELAGEYQPCCLSRLSRKASGSGSRLPNPAQYWQTRVTVIILPGLVRLGTWRCSQPSPRQAGHISVFRLSPISLLCPLWSRVWLLASVHFRIAVVNPVYAWTDGLSRSSFISASSSSQSAWPMR